MELKLYQHITNSVNYYSFINNELIDENFLITNFEKNGYKIFGRAQINEIQINNNLCIVRKYQRGGLLAKLLKDNYFKSDRFLNEFLILQYLIKRQFPTAAPAFLYVKKKFFFFNAWLGTVKIKEQINFIEYLEKINDRNEAQEKINKIFELIRQLMELNVYHTDLQIKNILICDDFPKIYIIDFDKARFIKNKLFYSYAMFFRFLRSIKKHRNKIEVLKQIDFDELQKKFEKIISLKKNIYSTIYCNLARFLFYH
ncbi:MAG TPA: lipopolysaccharide kinase InaA family protein [bacterium]|nr:lipopolysaccharide kinase InaA family protein [bacterium]